ncbi:MAG: hypothetical protein MZV70_72970 [Desulfobacterales bacterium]|nr:hypothetical protein [Desulfobacterales bacterium]
MDELGMPYLVDFASSLYTALEGSPVAAALQHRPHGLPEGQGKAPILDLLYPKRTGSAPLWATP